METALIVELLRAVWRELINWRGWVFGVFIVVTFAVIAVGMRWPENYQTSSMIFVDRTNIIQPLLKGQAVVTGMSSVQEQIYSRKLMQKVAKDVGLIGSDTTQERQEAIIGYLRNNVKFRPEKGNYFSIIYADQNQDMAFEVINAVVDTFIQDSAASRREESRTAYEFIDQQVESYRRQLIIAEDKLKEFQSRNFDGSTGSVATKIDQLRQQIEDQKLLIGETEIQLKTIQEQLQQESKAVAISSRLDAEKQRLQALRTQLDVLRLSYQETYPDIVALKEQIEAQSLSINAMQSDGYISGALAGDSQDTPLFDQLRVQKSQLELNLQSQKRRLASQENLLKGEYDRAERIASKQAQLSELTRDYNVIKTNYEEMLDRKEKARLSMTLDVEGQGVNYKIQEPAIYPLQPSGLRFIHFALAGPVAGLLVAIGLVVVYVLLDARIRSPIILMNKLPGNIELLAVIPHINTPIAQRLLRTDMVLLGLAFFGSLAVYAALIYVKVGGVI